MSVTIYLTSSHAEQKLFVNKNIVALSRRKATSESSARAHVHIRKKNNINVIIIYLWAGYIGSTITRSKKIRMP
jgi:hypothetical protein